MSGNFEIINMNMKMGMALTIEGMMPACADGFDINLGQGKDVVNIHFDPCFYQATIVCNSGDDSKQGQEQQGNPTIVRPRPLFKITIAFQENNFKVTLPNRFVICFPNWPGDKELHYLSANGLYVSSFQLE